MTAPKSRDDLAELDALERAGGTAIRGKRTRPRPSSAEPWVPQTFGGSTAVAGDLGEVAVKSARAGYDDNAYMFSRWAAREALAFLHQMDEKHQKAYERR